MSEELRESGWPWPTALGDRRSRTFPGAAFPIAFALGSKGRFFRAGELRLAVLSLLSEGPKHGYQLRKQLGERAGGIYHAIAGSVYPTLQLLEAKR